MNFLIYFTPPFLNTYEKVVWVRGIVLRIDNVASRVLYQFLYFDYVDNFFNTILFVVHRIEGYRSSFRTYDKVCALWGK